jgi:hypothetical protein
MFNIRNKRNKTMWLGHIYYSIGLINLLIIITFILNFFKISKLSEWTIKFKEKTGRSPLKTDYNSVEDYNLFNGISVLIVVEFLWTFVGLLTNSWYIFMFLIITSILLKITMRPIKWSFFNKIISLVFLNVKFMVYLFLIINRFHLHLDILELLKTF